MVEQVGQAEREVISHDSLSKSKARLQNTRKNRLYRSSSAGSVFARMRATQLPEKSSR